MACCCVTLEFTAPASWRTAVLQPESGSKLPHSIRRHATACVQRSDLWVKTRLSKGDRFPPDGPVFSELHSSEGAVKEFRRTRLER